MKIILFTFSIMAIFIALSSISNAEWEYSWKVERCSDAVSNWQSLLIKDFLCPQTSNYDRRVYNIVLDGEFRSVDKELHDFLNNLEKSKTYFFWKDRQKEYPEWVDMIQDFFGKGGVLYTKYYTLCNRYLEKSIYTLWVKAYGWTSIPIDFWMDNVCKRLSDVKLETWITAASAIMRFNKSQVRKEEFKKIQRDNREYYSNVEDLLRVHTWYTERLWKKWPSKTKDAY